MREIEEMFDEMIAFQEKKLLEIGQALIPHLTSDDVLQPNDFPLLDNHPHFRYEEGILKGLHSARMAFLAHIKSSSSKE